MKGWPLALLAAVGCAGRSSPAPTASPVPHEAFARGDFDAAEASLRGATDLESRYLLAKILLMRHRPGESARILHAITPRRAESVDDAFLLERLAADLALACLRQDDYLQASQMYARLQDPVRARKYEILGRSVGHRTAPGWEESILELLSMDPVPTVAGSVNGRRGVFVIDTGLGEILLDRDYARRAGVTPVSAEEGVADAVAFGRLAVQGVPVRIGRKETRAAARADGAVGLAFLLHFETQLDLRRGRLTLRRLGAGLPSSGAGRGLPAYVAGDAHLVVAARVNGSPTLVGIETALAGVTIAPSVPYFQARQSVLKDLEVGPLRFSSPAATPEAFPTGLDESYGFSVPAVLGPQALRGRVLTLDPRAMRITIE
ncbi:MAG TPA: hypothetical protein VEJ18_12810 [Planctomycetota bacterium]|nr:hypothetical protein [Planctomycetota bacterium]